MVVLHPPPEGELETLGACCICGADVAGVFTIIMLPLRNQVPGHGWGCVVCGLPSDGAAAVLCDPCFDLYQDGTPLRFACRGWPGSDGRVPIAELREPFDHDLARHRDAEDGIDRA